MNGFSYGVNVNVRKQIYPKLTFYVGVGYYRHRINDIDSRSSFGKSDRRIINFASPLFILFYVDRYHYNTVTANLGYEYRFFNRPNFYMAAAADANFLYTFSQYYHITHNPGGSQDYRHNRKYFMGAFGNVDASFMWRRGRMSVGPRMRVPVYSTLRTDDRFPDENGKDFRQRWFSGVGGGISFVYQLKPSTGVR